MGHWEELVGALVEVLRVLRTTSGHGQTSYFLGELQVELADRLEIGRFRAGPRHQVVDDVLERERVVG